MTAPAEPVSSGAFRAVMQRHVGGLLSHASYVRRKGGGPSCFTRPLLRGITCAATELEELLDVYGAARNRLWYPLRRIVAAAKLFSTVSYDLQHLLLFLPTYRLLPLEQDFASSTRAVLADICAILSRILEEAAREAADRGLSQEAASLDARAFEEELPEGRLSADRQSQKVASPEQTVAAVATAFLNLAEESAFIHVTQEPAEEPHAEWIPDPVNEARLRGLEQRFHSLQSLYDTHISDTNVESLDADLPVLRGHISVIFHLLEVGTSLTHYCERHILSFARAERRGEDAHPSSGEGALAPQVVNHEEVLAALVGYALAYASLYILRTRGLCHEMLRRYAVQGHIRVPVPRYRGFHVRPSTLVARIVAHYGSEVAMSLEQESYNAGFTLDLFRANEKISAVKRRLLARAVADSLAASPLQPETDPETDPEAAVRAVAQRLYAEGRLVLYDRNLSLEGFAARAAEGLPELVTRALTQMLTMGKIDVEMEIMASFSGDRRVLEDIRLLAQNGYGEDDFGNNLPLPPELQYLRR